MSVFRKKLLLFLCLIFPIIVYSQERDSIQYRPFSINGTVWKTGRSVKFSVYDRVSGKALPDASIKFLDKDNNIIQTLISGLDSTIPMIDSLFIEVSNIGYRTIRFVLKAQLPCEVQVDLAPIAMNIAQLYINGKKSAIIHKGDTTYFDARQFKTIYGASLSTLFNKFPGFIVSDRSISYNGRPIECIKINGDNLLGDNVMLALSSLKAEDVIGVEVYEELDKWDVHNQFKRPKKHLVANLKTKKFIDRIFTTPITLGKKVYSDNSSGGRGLSLNGKYIDGIKGRNFNISALIDDNMTDSIGQFNSSIRVGYSKNTDKVDWNTSHSFSVNNWRNQYFAETIYYGTQDNNSLDEVEDGFSKEDRYNYSGSAAYSKQLKKLASVSTDVSLEYKNIRDKSNNTNSRGQLNNVLSRSNQTKFDKTSDFDVNAGTNYSKNFRKVGIEFRSNSDIGFGYSKLNGMDLDTITASTNRIWNMGDGNSNEFDISENIQLGKTIGDFKLNASVKGSFDHSNCVNDFKDILRGITDTLDTRDYNINSAGCASSVSLDYYIGGGETYVGAGLSTDNSATWRTEHFPQYKEVTRKDNSWNYSFSFNAPLGSLSSIHLGFSNRASFENCVRSGNVLEDIYSLLNWDSSMRGAIDGDDPTNLKAGDANFKMPEKRRINFRFAYNGITIGVFNITASYSTIKNAISERVTYFDEDTYLPQYDYTVLKGAILHESMNVGTAKTFETNVTYHKYFQPLKHTIKMSYWLNHYDVPYFMGRELIKDKSNVNKLTTNITSSFSNMVSYDIFGTFSWDRKKNMQEWSKSSSIGWGCSLNISTPKSGHGMITFSRDLSFYNGEDIFHVSNLNVFYGYPIIRKTKSRKHGLSLGVSANNLLDNESQYRIVSFTNGIKHVRNFSVGRTYQISLTLN